MSADWAEHAALYFEMALPPLEAGKPFGLRPEAILPAYGMAETTLAVSFSECGEGLVVDEVDAVPSAVPPAV